MTVPLASGGGGKMTEVALSPGWLQRDVERAAARVEQWNRPMTPEAALLAHLREHGANAPDACMRLIREYGDRRAREERERCARLAEEQVERYHPDVSAVDVRESFTRGPKWRDGPKIAAAIRSLGAPQ